MKILHIVDYLMPDIGYQEYYLPKNLSEIDNIESVIITSDRYSNFKDYSNIWGNRLGNRIRGPSVTWDKNLKIIRLKVYFEFGFKILLKGLYSRLKSESPDFVFIHGTSSFSYFVVILFPFSYLTR